MLHWELPIFQNILVLMAAMTQTPLGVQGPGAHPFPMKEAWEWLASLLNEVRQRAFLHLFPSHSQCSRLL
jgi:hypothetical protein